MYPTLSRGACGSKFTISLSSVLLLPSVTPSDYDPPGFKEGVCDDLWFEGTAVHFKVGELQTPFHAMKVRVAAEQQRAGKLQESGHLRESGKVPVTSDPEVCSRDLQQKAFVFATITVALLPLSV